MASYLRIISASTNCSWIPGSGSMTSGRKKESYSDMAENCINHTSILPHPLPQIPQKTGGISLVGTLSPAHVECERMSMK